MKRIVGRDRPHTAAARRFLRGANLGNGLEAPPGQDWGVHYTPEDLRHHPHRGLRPRPHPDGMASLHRPGPEFRLRPEIFSRADELVHAGSARGWA